MENFSLVLKTIWLSFFFFCWIFVQNSGLLVHSFNLSELAIFWGHWRWRGGRHTPHPWWRGVGVILTIVATILLCEAPLGLMTTLFLSLPLEKLSYVFMHVSNQNYVLHNIISCDFGLNTFLSKSISLDNLMRFTSLCYLLHIHAYIRNSSTYTHVASDFSDCEV